jgi:hypothetical protein
LVGGINDKLSPSISNIFVICSNGIIPFFLIIHG